jgi:hypothetical protein
MWQLTASLLQDDCAVPLAEVLQGSVKLADSIVTYSGFSIHDGTLLHSKSQYTTVKHSRHFFEHTYTSDLYGLGTLIPIFL